MEPAQEELPSRSDVPCVWRGDNQFAAGPQHIAKTFQGRSGVGEQMNGFAANYRVIFAGHLGQGLVQIVFPDHPIGRHLDRVFPQSQTVDLQIRLKSGEFMSQPTMAAWRIQDRTSPMPLQYIEDHWMVGFFDQMWLHCGFRPYCASVQA